MWSAHNLVRLSRFNFFAGTKPFLVLGQQSRINDKIIRLGLQSIFNVNCVAGQMCSTIQLYVSCSSPVHIVLKQTSHHYEC